MFANHVTIIPAIKAILDSPDLRLDGFIGPGHVSTVIGCRPYEFIAQQYGKPVVVAGFEPLDILQSIYMLMVQLSQGRSEVENQYSRVVPWNGNPVALKAIGETMELRPYFEWRGLGFISHSALKVRDKYAAMDAELLFQVPGVRVADPKACQCGEVLKGVLKPWECKVFGTACTPETPIGTCMVSPEGACAAYYNFGRMNRNRVAETARGAGHDGRPGAQGPAAGSTRPWPTPRTRSWTPPGGASCRWPGQIRLAQIRSTGNSRCWTGSTARGAAVPGSGKNASRCRTAPAARRRRP